MTMRLLIVLLFFCGICQPAEAAGKVRIGLTLGLTGQYTEMADMQIKAFRLWEKQVNSGGGILGKPVELVILDDRSDPATARKLYEKLIKSERVDLLFAPYHSDLVEAIMPLLEANKYPLLSSGAASDRLWKKNYRYLFGVYAVASRYPVGFLEMLSRSGLQNVAIIFSEDAFGQSLGLGAKKWAERFGLKVVRLAGLKHNSRDYTSPVEAARKAGAQAIVVCGLFNEAVNVRQALKKSGWYPKAYYASVGPALPAYHEHLATDAEHTFSTSQWEPHSRFPGATRFYKSFQETYGQAPSYQAASAYAAGELLQKSAGKARSLDRQKIRDVLSTMNTVTIMGRYSVDRSGRQIGHEPLIIQWQHGKKEIVWPLELSTAKALFD
ncbi:MAG TPA: amino acid ABC transporter substrate-binding protein [Deltaproteobacteria bacterium]|nr:amino acid ABC transporter substrate-binding protein [Deltaproteobacteria bacterium]HQB38297.1 amino acid ABC transporter substrate-binding protein [Deltaproteobacteria bacterium]